MSNLNRIFRRHPTLLWRRACHSCPLRPTSLERAPFLLWASRTWQRTCWFQVRTPKRQIRSEAALRSEGGGDVFDGPRSVWQPKHNRLNCLRFKKKPRTYLVHLIPLPLLVQTRFGDLPDDVAKLLGEDGVLGETVADQPGREWWEQVAYGLTIPWLYKIFLK